MLTKKQLEDAAECNNSMICSKCSIPDCNIFKDKLDCISGLAKTALAYREMLERLEWIEHKDWLVECCPFCKKGKNQGHAPDCELAKLLKESEVKHDD